MKEIKAEGVDISKDAVKAIRKEAAKHNPNLGPNLGTVLVELRNEDIRGKIMKNKKKLENHPNQVLKEHENPSSEQVGEQDKQQLG